MQISAINSFTKASSPSFGNVHTAYLVNTYHKLKDVERDVVQLKTKANESKEREELIIKQNKDIIRGIYLLGMLHNKELSQQTENELNSLLQKHQINNQPHPFF